MLRRTEMKRTAWNRTAATRTEADAKRRMERRVRAMRAKGPDATDRKLRAAILTRDEHCCQFCGRNYQHDPSHLEVSHFANRRKASVRHDLRNVDLACIPCHRRLEHLKAEGQEYYEFKVRQLGEAEFEALRALAENTGLERVKTAEAKEIFLTGLRGDTETQRRAA